MASFINLYLAGSPSPLPPCCSCLFLAPWTHAASTVFCRLSCLRRSIEYYVATTPPPRFKTPRNNWELKRYIDSVKSLERVREEEWHTFQLLVNLVESEVWNWQPNTHDALLSQFFRLYGTVFISNGILTYPYMSKNITCIAPRELADLANYLDVITSHNLVTSGGWLWELVRFLSQTIARPTWDWVEGEYQGALDTLQEATGVLLTLEGPFCPARRQVLRSSIVASPRPCHNKHPRSNAPSRPVTRQATRGAPTHFGISTNRAVVADLDEVSDVASGNWRPWKINNITSDKCS